MGVSKSLGDVGLRYNYERSFAKDGVGCLVLSSSVLIHIHKMQTQVFPNGNSIGS